MISEPCGYLQNAYTMILSVDFLTHNEEDSQHPALTGRITATNG